MHFNVQNLLENSIVQPLKIHFYILMKNMSQFLAGNPYVLWQIWLHPFNITQVTRMDGRYFQTQILFKVEEVSKCLLKLARQVHNLHFCVSLATQPEML